MKVTIVKVGGKVLENPTSLEQFIESFKAIPGLKWLVHGGGNRATEIAEKLGIESSFINGRRVTSPEFLDVAVDTYAGINKKVVALLQKKGVSALGLCGADLQMIPSEKRVLQQVDFGFVGDPVDSEINTELLDFLLNSEITPVFSALSYDAHLGMLLNTNADAVAANLVQKLSLKVDVELVLAFEKNGVLLNSEDDSSVIQIINSAEIAVLKNDGIISNGMLPKMESAVLAIQNGAELVRITSYKALQSGTIIQ